MSDSTWLIESTLSQIFHSFVDAINKREFNSSAWDHLSPDFVYISDSPGPEREGVRAKNKGPSEYLATLQDLTTRCPNYRQHIKNTCIAIYAKANFAEAAFDIDVHGLFPDVIRPHVTHVEFRFREGKWVCTLAEEVSGHAIPDGTTGELVWPERRELGPGE